MSIPADVVFRISLFSHTNCFKPNPNKSGSFINAKPQATSNACNHPELRVVPTEMSRKIAENELYQENPESRVFEEQMKGFTSCLCSSNTFHSRLFSLTFHSAV